MLTFSFRKEPGVKPHGGYTYSFFLREEESEKRKVVSFLLTFSFREEPGVKPHGGYTYSFFLWEEESEKRKSRFFFAYFFLSAKNQVSSPTGVTHTAFFFGKKRVEKEMPFLFCLRFLSAKKKVRAGVYYGEVPPVPIPNTEVKLTSAEDTWREAAWKNRSSPAQRIAVPAGAAIHSYSSLAQSVEHAAVNRRVVGSSPTGGATQTEPLKIQRLCFHQPFQGPLAQLVRATGS